MLLLLCALFTDGSILETPLLQEMLLALAVLDLPFQVSQPPVIEVLDGQLQFTATAPMIVFYKVCDALRLLCWVRVCFSRRVLKFWTHAAVCMHALAGLAYARV